MNKKCSKRRKGDDPAHIHYGPYDRVKFGKHDEQEAVNDYTELRGHLKSLKSKKILTHIINEEKEHKREFKRIARLEKGRR